MGDASGVGGSSFKPTEKTSSVGQGGPSGEEGPNVLNVKVKTLGDLKEALIQNLGKEKGEKFYNNFLKSFALSMLNQIRQSAQQAKDAAKQMRDQQS